MTENGEFVHLRPPLIHGYVEPGAVSDIRKLCIDDGSLHVYPYQEPAGIAVGDIFRPIVQRIACDNYLGRVSLRDANILCRDVLPGQTYNKSADEWHTDSFAPPFGGFSVADKNATEFLVGHLPTSKVCELYPPFEQYYPRAMGACLEEVGQRLSKLYSDLDLINELGLTIMQPGPGVVYQVPLEGLHRAPRNHTDQVESRVFIQPKFSVVAGHS